MRQIFFLLITFGLLTNVTHAQDPNDMLDNPDFVNMTTGSEDYQLDIGSPAINAGSDGTDMGAWGGADPMDWSHGLPH